jgi:hypothetical protein
MVSANAMAMKGRLREERSQDGGSDDEASSVFHTM